MRLRSTFATQPAGGGGGGGGGGVGIGTFSKCVILVAVSAVLVSNDPSEVSVAARHASKSVILSSICCIMSVRLSTLLAIFACSD
jgi:predicted metalloprotease